MKYMEMHGFMWMYLPFTCLLDMCVLYRTTQDEDEQTSSSSGILYSVTRCLLPSVSRPCSWAANTKWKSETFQMNEDLSLFCLAVIITVFLIP